MLIDVGEISRADARLSPHDNVCWEGRNTRRASFANGVGHAFDPEVAGCLADDAGDIVALDTEASVWDEVLSREPTPRLTLEGKAIDRALTAMANSTDLISPYLAGHSIGVSDLAPPPRSAAASTRPAKSRLGAPR